MTIVQMQYFQAVCRFESFTRAAEAQHISQPAMSAAMKELEAEVGVPLFQKTRNSLTLTEAARTLLSEVDAVLDQYDRLMRVAGGLSAGHGCVHVGVSTLNGNLVYPAILAAFSRQYPQIQVTSVEVPTSTQFELLDRGRLDVAINGFESAGRGFEGKLSRRPLVQSEMVFCVSSGHQARRCILCGRYFLVKGGAHTLYCEGECPQAPRYTCRQYGTYYMKKERAKDNPKLAARNTALDTVRKHKSRGLITEEQAEREKAFIGKIYWEAGLNPDYSVERFAEEVSADKIYSALGIQRKEKSRGRPPKKGGGAT